MARAIKIKALHAIADGASAATAAASCGLSLATVRRAVRATKGRAREDWEKILSDNRNHSGPRAQCEIDPRWWRVFKADYLRLEQPTAAGSHQRVAVWAEKNEIVTPQLQAVYRAINRLLSPQVLVATRQGKAALHDLYPPQQRHTQGLSALSRVNADGWPVDFFAQAPTRPDGTPGPVIRPHLIVVQDVASRAVVGWKLAESESAEAILAALTQVVREHGIPQHLHLDNTRAASAKWLGGDKSRRGKRLTDDESFAGVLGELGIDLHRTILIGTSGTTASGRQRHVGSGKSKPVERLFRWFADRIAKHPALAGHYTGRSTSHKPENYSGGRSGVSWETAEQVIAEVIAATNAQENRRAVPLAASGESADQCLARLQAQAPARPATDEDLAALLTPAETVKVTRHGTFSLAAGAAPGFGKNHYYSEELFAHAGAHLLVRYDPANLHAPVRVTDHRGRLICWAPVDRAAGFGDTAKAATRNRARREFERATVRAAKAEQQYQEQDLAEIIAANTGTKPRQECQIIRLKTGTDSREIYESHHQSPRRDVAAAWEKISGGNNDDW